MFSSMTPNSIFLLMLLKNFSSSITLPAPNISSATILIASDTDALPPMCPFANGNKPAEVTFLTCVTGDRTVLPY